MILPIFAHAGERSEEVTGSADQWCSYETPCNSIRESVCMKAKADARSQLPQCHGFQGACECAMDGSLSAGTASMRCEATVTASCYVADAPSPGPGPQTQPGPTLKCSGPLDSWADKKNYSSRANPAYMPTTWVTFKNHIMTLHFTNKVEGRVVGHTFAFDPADLDVRSGTIHLGTSGQFEYVDFKTKNGQKTVEYQATGQAKEMVDNIDWELTTLEDARGAKDQIISLIRACAGGTSLNEFLKKSGSEQPEMVAIEDDSAVSKTIVSDEQVGACQKPTSATELRVD